MDTDCGIHVMQYYGLSNKTIERISAKEGPERTHSNKVPKLYKHIKKVYPNIPKHVQDVQDIPKILSGGGDALRGPVPRRPGPDRASQPPLGILCISYTSHGSWIYVNTFLVYVLQISDMCLVYFVQSWVWKNRLFKID